MDGSPDTDRSDERQILGSGEFREDGRSEIEVESRQASAREFARARRLFLVADLLLTLVLLLAILVSGASLELRRLLEQLTPFKLVLVALYVAVVGLGYSLLDLPLAYWSGHVLPLRFGISTQTSAAWLVDWVKELPLTGLFGLAIAEVMYVLLGLLPDLWWLATAAILLMFSVGVTFIAPVLLVPLFYRLTPLDGSELTARLTALAGQAGAGVRGVFKMDLSRRTTAANAALVGLGSTRRIVIGDTLLDSFSTDEIEAVFAHELGHHVHRDIGQLVGAQAVLSLVGLFVVARLLAGAATAMGFAGLADVASLPLIALGLFAFEIVTMPLSNAISRHAESEADRYALQATSRPEAFVSAMRRLANQNLAEYRPSRWAEILLYSHPAPFRRVEMGEEHLRSHGTKP